MCRYGTVPRYHCSVHYTTIQGGSSDCVVHQPVPPAARGGADGASLLHVHLEAGARHAQVPSQGQQVAAQLGILLKQLSCTQCFGSGSAFFSFRDPEPNLIPMLIRTQHSKMGLFIMIKVFLLAAKTKLLLQLY